MPAIAPLPGTFYRLQSQPRSRSSTLVPALQTCIVALEPLLRAALNPIIDPLGEHQVRVDVLPLLRDGSPG